MPNSINDMDFADMSAYKVVYIIFVGKNEDGQNIYHFLLSTDDEETFAEGWSEKPACAEKPEHMMIADDMFEYVKELRTDIKLDLAQDSCSFSMQDARDHCVALAYENLDEAEESPDEGRIVIQFGDPIDEVEDMLARRELKMRFV